MISTRLVPEAAEQAARYGEAITAELIAAAEAGAASVNGEPSIDLGPTGPLAAVRESLVAAASSTPLRERLEPGCRPTGDGDNDAVTKRVRGVYREWKTQRIDERLDDLFRLAYVPRSRGGVAAGRPWCSGSSTRTDRRRPTARTTRWPARRRSATTFPSGHQWPPTHPGCRCLLVAGRRVACGACGAPRTSPAAAGHGGASRAAPCSSPSASCSCVVVIFGRAVARFYIDYLWHDGLGRADVFWGVIRAKATLFGMFFGTFALLAGLNLLIADKLAPSRFPANVHPYVERFHELFGHRLRLLRYVGAGVLAVMVALPTTSQWQSWLLFRNGQSFGVADAQFGADVGFYVFDLPFLTLRARLAVRRHGAGAPDHGAGPRPQRRRRVRLPDAVGAPGDEGAHRRAAGRAGRPEGRRLLGVRYETTNERRGFVQGATYAVVNAQLPALMLLMLIALLTAGLYLATMRRTSWRLPLIASGLWLVADHRRPAGLPGRCAVARRQPQPAVAGGASTSSATCWPRGTTGIGIEQVDVQRGVVRPPHRRRRRRPTSSRCATSACSTRPRCCRGSASTMASRPACPSTTSTSIATSSTASGSRCSSPPASSTSTAARTRAGRVAT